jgi:streptogramin lyase
MVIPNASASSATARKPAFVSPSTNGVVVTTYAHSDSAHQSPLATSVTDVSSGSGACATGAATRTCTISSTAPLGTDDFAFVLYDTAPAGGTIPAAAHILGTAGVTQTIFVNATNIVNAGVNALIVGLAGQASAVRLGADGAVHNIGLTIAPTDFGNNAIVAGSSNVPFANPITVTATESGGSGHATLQLNGAPGATQVTVMKSSDTVQVVYDGGGSSGYQVAVALTAAPVNGQGGATEIAVISPVLFVSNPTVFFASSPAQVKTYPEGQHVLTISEPTAPAGTAYTATATGCTNILSIGTIVGNATSSTLLVAGGTTISSAGCNLAIGDGTATFNLAVSNTLRAFTTPALLHEYQVAALEPVGIASGTDGNLWFSEGINSTSPSISSIKPDGTGYTPHALAGWGQPYGVTLGADGKIWVGDDGGNDVASVTSSGTIAAFSTQTQPVEAFLTAGLDGLIWFAECNGPAGIIANRSASGTLHELTVPGGRFLNGTTLGPDGNIWFDDCSNNRIGRIVNGVATEFPATTASQPSAMTAGPDGNVWFTEGTTIGRMTPSGTLTEFPVTSGGINVLVPGPDGALWFTDARNNAIGRITTTGAITEYPLPNLGSTPFGITVGPDGNLWFTEAGPGAIGVYAI